MTIDESWYHRPPGIAEHTSAGGVVVRWKDDRLFIALVREGASPDYVLPKGHVEPGETVDQAAQREILEEAGLRRLRVFGELAVRERLDFKRTAWKRTHYFLYLVDPESDDRGRASWFPLDALPPMFWPEQRELLETHRSQIAGLVTQAGQGHPGGDRRNEATQRQFGRRAGAYAQSATHRHDTDLDLLLEHLHPTQADRVLDVATGTGFTALAFRPRVRSVVGVDLTWGMLKEAQGLMRAGDRIGWVVADAEALPFGDGTFSLVTCRRAPHHFVHLERAIEEMLRVLTSGGRLGLVDQVSPEEDSGHRLMEALEILRDGSHVRALTASRWQALLASRGVVPSMVQIVERRQTVAEWLELAGTDPTRRDAIDTALRCAPGEARAQIGYQATPTASFLRQLVVFVGRKKA